jgi:DNA repair protein RadC
MTDSSTGAPVATKAVYKYSLQRRKVLEVREECRVSEPAEVAAFVRELGLVENEQEHFLSIMLDAKHAIRGYTLVTIGLVDRTQVHSREVFRSAILQGATKIVLAHNHPSGDYAPSAQDVACTRQLVEAGKIIGIEVLDHVIVGQPNVLGRDFFSFREQAML